jgi:3-isopropylmalate dehydrogenase
VAEALLVIEVAIAGEETRISFEHGLLGGHAIDETGSPLPPETLDLLSHSDAILAGAVGGPKWDHLPFERNPGPGGLLRLRRQFDLFANLRPARALVPGVGLFPDFDLLIVRESTGGAYFSLQKGSEGIGPDRRAFDLIEYTAAQVERVLAVACNLALGRGGRLTSVDKANVLESSRLWRDVAEEVCRRYDGVELEHMYVDNCALQLVLAPEQFDVIVTENLFGDILSDQAAGLVGSLGLLPSATVGFGDFGLFEPVHGSAPDIAGKGVVNPVATILSGAMLLRHALGLGSAADRIETAVERVLAQGHGTAEVVGSGESLGTRQIGELICAEVGALAEAGDGA